MPYRAVRTGPETAVQRIARRLREGKLDPRLIRFVDTDGQPGAGVAIVGVPARPEPGKRPDAGDREQGDEPSATSDRSTH